VTGITDITGLGQTATITATVPIYTVGSSSPTQATGSITFTIQ
jgi:hypothetical protein